MTRPPERTSTDAAILARIAGSRNVMGLTIGPSWMRLVHSAASESETHVSMQSRSGVPIKEVRWSLRRSESKPSVSASWQIPRHLSQLRPSWPSIMIPTFAMNRDRKALGLRLGQPSQLGSDALPGRAKVFEDVCPDPVSLGGQP